MSHEKFTSVLAIFAAASCSSDEAPQPGRTFIYDSQNSSSRSSQAPTNGESTFRFIDSEDGTTAYLFCNGNSPCFVRQQRNFLERIKEVHLGFDETGASSISGYDGHLGTVDFRVFDRSGGTFFPLQDGKTLGWREEEVLATDVVQEYQVRVTQRCCVPTSNPAAKTKRLWRITYEWRLLNEESGRFSGTNQYYYDPELEWFVEATLSADDQGNSGTSASTSKLSLRHITSP